MSLSPKKDSRIELHCIVRWPRRTSRRGSRGESRGRRPEAAAVGGLEPRSAATNVAAVGGLEPRSAASSRGRRPLAAVGSLVAAVGGLEPRSAASSRSLRPRGRARRPRSRTLRPRGRRPRLEAEAADLGTWPPTAACGRRPRQPGR